MKLFYSPASPFARKARAAAIELGLSDRVELEFVDTAPGKPNRAYAQAYNPLRKIPALLCDDGATIYDSTLICEYLDVLAGGGKPAPPPHLDANAQFAAAEHEYVVYFMQQFPVVATYLGGSAFDPQLADIDGKLRNDSFAALNI